MGSQPIERGDVMHYAARLTPGLPGEGGYLMTFRDVPEAITEVSTVEEALKYAAEALELALSYYPSEHKAIRAPTPKQAGEYFISVPTSQA